MKLNNILYLLIHIIKIPRFLMEFIKFKSEARQWSCNFKDMLPMLNDDTSVMGFDAHYVYHTGWAARVLKEIDPIQHIDISSSIMFCSVASAFIPIKHYDYRQPILKMSQLDCGSQDLSKLTFLDNSIESLSCMHVIEHIGLGRYGDPINASGDEVAASELMRVLAPGGSLLVVLPLAERARIRFNGHRIYSFQRVIKIFSGLELIEFSFMNDAKENKFTRFASQEDIVGSDYGCGCFVFRKQKN
jgi:hypothetical protein